MRLATRVKYSRRAFLASLPFSIAAAATTTGKGRLVPSAIERYPDPSTEFPVDRLTDPSISSILPPADARTISRRGNFMLYAGDSSGRMEAYRMDLKSGQSRQITDAAALDPRSLRLFADERSFAYLDGGRLFIAKLDNLQPRPVYGAPEGFDTGAGLGLTTDGLYAALVEHNASHYRLRLIHLPDGTATTLAEADEEISDPVPRPRRASILYRRMSPVNGSAVWLANFDAQQNYRLRLAEGETAQATWSPDGRTVLYLNFPADTRKLHNLREFIPDSNQDQAIANTSQFVCFDRNGDASVFVGASGSKASPHVLLLVRAVQREFTLCEHHASDPRMVQPVFAPSSQRIFFNSDRHGKPAIYTMAVEKLVSETDTQ